MQIGCKTWIKSSFQKIPEDFAQGIYYQLFRRFDLEIFVFYSNAVGMAVAQPLDFEIDFSRKIFWFLKSKIM